MGHRRTELRRRKQRRLTRRTTLVAVAVAAGLVAGALGIHSALEPAASRTSVTATAGASADGAAAAAADGSSPGQTGAAEGATKAPATKHDQNTTPLKEIPKDQPERGMVYTGLNLPSSDGCAGLLQVAGSSLCSHGPDAAPEGVDIHKTVPPVADATASAPGPGGGSSQPPAADPSQAMPVPDTATAASPGAPVPDTASAASSGAPLPDPGTAASPGHARVPRPTATASPSAPVPHPTTTASPGAATPSPSKAPAGTEVVCDGDGTTGFRVQVLYVHGPDQDQFAAYKNSMKKWAADVDVIYRASAEQTGGNRHVRYVTDADCTASVLDIEVPAAALGNFGATNDALVAQGFNRRDRKYMLFTDAHVYCGLGNFAADDRPGQDNPSNFGPSYARVDAGCWSAHAAAHELGHNLGAVNNSAPDSSKHSHCVNQWDLMCYKDTSATQLKSVCPDYTNYDRLDCTHDNYYSTNPKPGGYLSSHWNVADNQFLIGGGPDRNNHTPVLPEVTITQLTATSVTFTFPHVPGASKFRLVINGQAGYPIPDNTRAPNNLVPMAGLKPGTDYEIAIEVVDADGKSSDPGRKTTFHTPAG
ncbi:hypothetical protein [Kitasatospora sp. NPDC096140]|uniref:hypothetical protein n=1 Tax=Kitasatospora sp. NPDC096140 TaxID=3155425 RepID=UPI00331B64D4